MPYWRDSHPRKEQWISQRRHKFGHSTLAISKLNQGVGRLGKKIKNLSSQSEEEIEDWDDWEEVILPDEEILSDEE